MYFACRLSHLARSPVLKTVLTPHLQAMNVRLFACLPVFRKHMDKQ
jgi:hypothetical protein